MIAEILIAKKKNEKKLDRNLFEKNFKVPKNFFLCNFIHLFFFGKSSNEGYNDKALKNIFYRFSKIFSFETKGKN